MFEYDNETSNVCITSHFYHDRNLIVKPFEQLISNDEFYLSVPKKHNVCHNDEYEYEYIYAGLKYSLKNDDILKIMCCDRENVTWNEFIFDKHEELKQENKFFNLDSKNKIFFTEKQRTHIINFLIKKDIIEKIKNAMSGVKLRLQQQKMSVDTSFCNEHIYGTVSIIEINCLIDLDFE
jgi:hypothetical protein